jgi:DNA-binding FadR family transcriptional regulator
MKPFELEPRYSTNEVPGKCIKCLGEQELNNCLLKMLREEAIDEEVQNKYEALVAFLQSPESRQLREESEKYLAEGKKVSIVIGSNQGHPEYKLKIE